MQVLENLLDSFKSELKAVSKVADLLNLKAKYIGKQGPMAEGQRNQKCHRRTSIFKNGRTGTR